jgi:hypothetical protein
MQTTVLKKVSIRSHLVEIEAVVEVDLVAVTAAVAVVIGADSEAEIVAR